MIRALSFGILLLLAAGCASQRSAVPLSDDARLNAFLKDVRSDVEEHAWNEVLAAADSAHHATQVQEHGMAEPQYVAELFGLHMVANDIGDGEPIEWTHLNRIETLRFGRLEETGIDAWVARGVAVSDDGNRFDVQVHVIRQDDAFRLTGGLG